MILLIIEIFFHFYMTGHIYLHALSVFLNGLKVLNLAISNFHVLITKKLTLYVEALYDNMLILKLKLLPFFKAALEMKFVFVS